MYPLIGSEALRQTLAVDFAVPNAEERESLESRASCSRLIRRSDGGIGGERFARLMGRVVTATRKDERGA